MNIRGIDHLELYVGDAQQSSYYFNTAFGFEVAGQGGPETGLVGQRSLLMVQGEVRLLLTSGLYAEHPAAEYVQRHGDGVAVIGLAVDDAAATFAELVSRGAEPIAAARSYQSDGELVIVAEVGGIGDIIHRLVQRDRSGIGSLPRASSGPGAGFLPGAIVDPPQPAGQYANTQHPGGQHLGEQPSTAGGPLLRSIDHLAICVPEHQLQVTGEHYQRVFGFSQIFTEYIEVAGQGMNSLVVQSDSGQVTYTLIEPDTSRRSGQIDEFLRSHSGAGVQHIAMITDDIVATVDHLGSRGVRFLNTPGSYYDTLEQRVGELDAPIDELRRLGILVDSDHWGQLLQIFTESTHVRRTLFIEVIERRGARTFGSGNIKALYEAKERELAGAPVPIAAEPDIEGAGI